ncbi:MAG TPA: hypothetical protein VHA56_17965 [Mucilaginibacter sp.]|nr:hypothetical protein [Mucilaginibacter sp.]
MKIYVFVLLLLMMLGRNATGQVSLSLALNSRPQPWLAEWSNPVNGAMIITFMPGAAGGDPLVRLRTTLLNESQSAIAVTNMNNARIYNLKQGTNYFNIGDALQFQNLVFQGNVRALLQRTGRLAAGQYQLMVEVMNNAGDVVIARQTRPFFVTSYQLPVLLQPANDANLDAHIAQNVIIFRWTNLVPGGQELPEYRVQVFEIKPGQTAMQAFRGNRPLLDEAAPRGATQYIWRPMLPMPDSVANRKFIWTVQTLDREGNPIPTEDSAIEGRSEPAIFNIADKRALPQEPVLHQNLTNNK